MSLENVPKRGKFADQLGVEIAVDADLNNKWENAGAEYETPAKRMSIKEALLAQTRLEDITDRLPQSDS